MNVFFPKMDSLEMFFLWIFRQYGRIKQPGACCNGQLNNISLYWLSFPASLLCPLFPRTIFLKIILTHLSNKTLSQNQLSVELGNNPVSTKIGLRQQTLNMGFWSLITHKSDGIRSLFLLVTGVRITTGIQQNQNFSELLRILPLPFFPRPPQAKFFMLYNFFSEHGSVFKLLIYTVIFNTSFHLVFIQQFFNLLLKIKLN